MAPEASLRVSVDSGNRPRCCLRRIKRQVMLSRYASDSSTLFDGVAIARSPTSGFAVIARWPSSSDRASRRPLCGFGTEPQQAAGCQVLPIVCGLKASTHGSAATTRRIKSPVYLASLKVL